VSSTYIWAARSGQRGPPQASDNTPAFLPTVTVGAVGRKDLMSQPLICAAGLRLCRQVLIVIDCHHQLLDGTQKPGNVVNQACCSTQAMTKPNASEAHHFSGLCIVQCNLVHWVATMHTALCVRHMYVCINMKCEEQCTLQGCSAHAQGLLHRC
jgi:hypothetical protein